MGPFQRLAIYWTPQPGSELAAFAETWFANMPSASENANNARTSLPRDLHNRATRDPARYLLHATLKPPFRLADGTCIEDVQNAIQSFCSRRRVIAVGPLLLTRYHKFLALVPLQPVAAAEWLADQCVTHFDRFRAPLNEEDRKRRAIGGGQIEQMRLFEEFGYPYIFSAFRFHVTLAGPLDETEIGLVENALRPVVQDFDRPFLIESLTLLGETESGQFEVVSRHDFMR